MICGVCHRMREAIVGYETRRCWNGSESMSALKVLLDENGTTDR